MGDPMWRKQVVPVIRSMVQPLVTDGGRFDIVFSDEESRTVVVQADMGSCSVCVMSNDDLARLLQEAIERTSPGVKVTVQSS